MSDLPAGPELDRSLWEALGNKYDESRCRICGWPLAEKIPDGCTEKSCSERPVRAPSDRWDAAPRYSTDGNAMLRVISALRERGWRAELDNQSNWECLFRHHDGRDACGHADNNEMPLAIARAALAALRPAQS